MLGPVKARQVHRVQADRKILMEPLGMLDMSLLKGGRSKRAASCVCPLHVTACHLSPSVLPSGKPLPPLYTEYRQSWQGVRVLRNTARFCTCEPTQGYGNSLSGPFSRLWKTASLSCPDIWVRRPDWLRFPYRWNGSVVGQGMCNLLYGDKGLAVYVMSE